MVIAWLFLPGLPAIVIGGIVIYIPGAWLDDRVKSRGRNIDQLLPIAIGRTAAGLLASDTDINGSAVPVNWTTPVGFPVRQNYRKTEIKQVDTVLNGKCFDKFELEEKDGMRRVKLNVRTGDVGLDSYKQRNGISPNFVHSMDASHLMLTVLECHSKGINSMSLIHDSYGCHAGKASILFSSVREVFVRTYSENNVLQDMHDHVMNMLSPEQADKLPPIPTFGNLDLNCVKKSLYAFA